MRVSSSRRCTTRYCRVCDHVSIRADASELLEVGLSDNVTYFVEQFQFALMRVSSSRVALLSAQPAAAGVSIRADASELLEEPPRNIASDQRLRHPFTRHPKKMPFPRAPKSIIRYLSCKSALAPLPFFGTLSATPLNDPKVFIKSQICLAKGYLVLPTPLAHRKDLQDINI